MSQFIFISLSVAAAVSCLMALRMYGDWLAITACGEIGDSEPLLKLREALTCWVARHLSCAVVATILCIMIRLVPSLHAFPGADALLAGYGILSLLFASLDHALSQLVVIAMKQARVNQS
jgi:hypothetical protein